MSHFYVTAKGNRGGASRTGSAMSGITAHARGWNVGIEARGLVFEDDGRATDAFHVTLTTGSNGYNQRRFAIVTRDEATGGWIVDLERPDGSRETLTYPA